MAARMMAAVAVEYEALAAEAAAARTAETATRRRVTGRLRRQLHRIESRDYFPSPRREPARRAVEELAATDPVQVPG
jgi:hypothetical protein